MLRKVVTRVCGCGSAREAWSVLARRRYSISASSAVDSILLRSLKEHYLEVSKMNPPPKINPPSPFSIVKGALDSSCPVLQRTYRDEDINITVMKLANIIPEGGDDDDNDDGINQLFIHVNISKPGQKNCLQILCGLYPDALGIHSVSLKPNGEAASSIGVPSKYTGPLFEDLDEKVRDALYNFIEERGINENLFTFLQAWLYVKDHRKLMQWFRAVGVFVNYGKQSKGA